MNKRGMPLCRLVYLSSSPPSFRTIFRKEKTVPKINLASSSALNAARGTVVDEESEFDSMLDFEALTGVDSGFDSHSRLYMHSAVHNNYFSDQALCFIELTYCGGQKYKMSRPP